MPFFEHQQTQFNYEISGSGPVIVLCHGLTGDLLQIRELLGDFRDFTVLLWDARGHGHTDPIGSAKTFTFRQFASDLHALLTHLAIDRAVVGGVSMGAGVATRFALDHAEMVEGLILIRPAWLDRPNPMPLALLALVGDLLATFGHVEGRQRFMNSAAYKHLKVVDSAAAQSLCDQFIKPKAAERCIRLQRMPASHPVRNWKEVLRLKSPSIVLGCKGDYVHPYEFAVEWSERLPKATLVEVPPKATEPRKHNRAVQRAIRNYLGALDVRRPKKHLVRAFLGQTTES